MALVLVWNSVLTLPRVEVLNAVGISMLAALTPRLNGRAFHSTIGAIYAAIALPWLQDSLAVFTLVEERTCILWHGFFLGEGTLRAGDVRF